MTVLSAPIRQGFITAKAVRLSSVCIPGFNPSHFRLTEDLAIEDYITSHALKNCLLTKLKSLQHMTLNKTELVDDTELEVTNDTAFSDAICKYVIADHIYGQFQADAERKKMRAWHASNDYGFLIDCGNCDGEEDMCCRKRIIRLALVKIYFHE